MTRTDQTCRTQRDLFITVKITKACDNTSVIVDGLTGLQVHSSISTSVPRRQKYRRVAMLIDIAWSSTQGMLSAKPTFRNLSAVVQVVRVMKLYFLVK